MKRKLLSLLPILLVIMLIGCGETTPITTEPEPEKIKQGIVAEPSATFTITSFDQTGSYISIYYEVQNNGKAHLSSYKVYFTITCADGSHHQHQSEGKHVLVGQRWSPYTILKLEDKKVTSVDITDFELTAGKVPEVIYEITGSAKKVDITLNNAMGGTEQYSDIYIPVKQTYSSFSNYFLYISAQNQGEYGTVRVTIYLNGEVFKTAYSSGAYVIATASGSK